MGAAKTDAAIPDAIAAPGTSEVLRVHAEGAQVYECKAAAGGTLAWQLREPVATLMADGKTVGRHYAGPTFEHIDGSIIVIKAAATVPAPDGTSIPWVRADVVSAKGNGVLTGVTALLRINTRGGALSGACDIAGSIRGVGYAADYVFLKRNT